MHCGKYIRNAEPQSISDDSTRYVKLTNRTRFCFLCFGVGGGFGLPSMPPTNKDKQWIFSTTLRRLNKTN